MATINIMAEDTPASELEEDQELLIEALRRHLTYVEVNATVVQITHPVVVRSIESASPCCTCGTNITAWALM